MDIVPIYFDEWSAEEGYIPTQHVEGYRALNDDGKVIAWGETVQEARENALRALWLV